MYFSHVAFLALPLLAFAVEPPCDNENGCVLGSSQYCCNSVQHADALSATQKSLLGFLGASLDNAQGQFGFACNPITGAAAYKGGAASFGTAGCNGQSVCCQDSKANGFVAMNCNPIIGNA